MKILSWIGTFTSIIGAFLVAWQILFIGYIAFAIGSSTWLIIGFVRRDNALLTLNAVFFLANILGLYKALI